MIGSMLKKDLIQVKEAGRGRAVDVNDLCRVLFHGTTGGQQGTQTPVGWD